MSENLVNLFTFPGPKKASEPVTMSTSVIDDPLADLLNETGLEDGPSTEPAPVMEFSQVEEPKLLSKRDLINYMEAQIGLLREASRRMDYYVEEIEAYLPQK